MRAVIICIIIYKCISVSKTLKKTDESESHCVRSDPFSRYSDEVCSNEKILHDFV